MKAVVIAAGKGVRLRPITDHIPKCLAEVKGKPILEHVLERIIKAGIEEVHLVVGYKKDLIEDHFGPEFNGVKLNYFVQEEPKGTAHAVSLTEKYIDDKFLITNADVIISTTNYRKLIETDEFEKADGFIVARKVNDPWRYGVLKTDGMKLLNIIEKPKPGEEPSNLVNAGIYRVRKEFFEAINQTPKSVRGEYEIVDSLKIFMKSGKHIETKMCEGSCIDIGSKEDLERADSMMDSIFPD
mgnify:CR=1 FL=1